jgi:interferon gamma-inducible protein 30
MLNNKKAILLLIITIATLSLINSAAVPQIDLYVESLCSDCQDFIGGSFAKYLQNPDYASLAHINFYPYGNAKEVKVGENYEFTCQHGANECYGNIIETCSLNKMSHEEGLKFMICMENGIRTYDKNINKALEHCVEEQTLVQSIIDCAHGTEGNLLQHAVAQATPANHNYVPWIHFNGEHDKSIEAALLENMNEFLCGLEGNKHNAVCGKSNGEKSLFEKSIYKNFNSLTQKCPNIFLIGGIKFLEN